MSLCPAPFDSVQLWSSVVWCGEANLRGYVSCYCRAMQTNTRYASAPLPGQTRFVRIDELRSIRCSAVSLYWRKRAPSNMHTCAQARMRKHFRALTNRTGTLPSFERSAPSGDAISADGESHFKQMPTRQTLRGFSRNHWLNDGNGKGCTKGSGVHSDYG